MRKWEEEYKQIKNGKLDVKMQELKQKVEQKKATKEEYNEYQKYQKVKENLGKVENILEFRKSLEKKKEQIDKELQNREDLAKIPEQIEKLEKEFEKLEKDKEELQDKLKDPKLEAIDRSYLENKLKMVSAQIDANHKSYSDAHDELRKNVQKNNRLSKISKTELDKQKRELSKKISKCNMVAANLLKGRSWDSIEVKLDDWKEYTSKEKTAIGKERAEKENSQEKAQNSKEKQEESESKEMVEVSEFDRKHPRLAKIKNMFRKAKEKIFSKKNAEKAEEAKEQEAQEEKEKDNDFKKELREIAERGMKEVRREKLDKYKSAAYDREVRKFGQEYAERSYHKEDEGR